MHTHVRAIFTVLALLFTTLPGSAQWRDIGSMPAPEQRDSEVEFRNDTAVAQIRAITPDIVRVRIVPGPALGRDHSYAVVGAGATPPAPSIRTAEGRTTLETAAVRVVLQHAPFRVSFEDSRGESLDSDDPGRGIAFAGPSVRVWKRLRDDEQVYGFGEKTGRLNKRGRKLGGYSYAMWNSDTYAYGPDTDPIYASVPFYIVLRNGRAHGIFFDNTFRSSFDVGHQSAGLLSFGADGGELNYYFIAGPAMADVLRRYAELTGRMPLPPLWALGYHQCRYSYYPEARARFIAQNFRQRRIPADVLWLDIHYQDRYRPFTWDPKRFPNPVRLLGDLRRDGFRVVTIVDPHPAKLPGHDVYESGLRGGHFVTAPDGSVYEAPVWPSQAETDPRPSVFPDFSRSATRDWWGDLYRAFLEMGVAGIWNDMNEPAVFVEPSGTMPLDVRHDNEGQATDHREIHNVYGMLMTRATFEGLLRARPDERPFVLTRATFAGGQRYAAVWPGDNVSDWEHLRASVPMLLGMGLSGLAFVGSDIGGFAEAPSAELYTRWLQTGVFYPFMRTHTTFGTPDQEPWSYGTRHEDINRRFIELRYELLPYIYNEMHKASDTGVPAMRPLVLQYPDDPATYEIDDQFMLGEDLLVAPVMREGARGVTPYLPRGEWFDFWTGHRFAGGTRVQVPVTIESLPIFARAGAFVFRSPVVQHTGELPGTALHVMVFPAADSAAVLYEDDGLSLGHQRGTFVRRSFRQSRTGADGSQAVTIAVEAPEGPYRPAARSIVFHVRVDAEPNTVSANGHPVERRRAAELETQDGWSYTAEGVVVVRQPDRFEPLSLAIR